ncbi:hypothetical protein R1sor_024913 [Riccia sorocarpa]|uniref:DNA mismatch repair proteins mutS family domain-containing protein n=1 Tax=Riccia sorocarpa TaxID=122646 RepID=A0ABD3GU43_9MARC
MAELGGASESQIRRLGKWNNQAMENCYLTSLPRETLRTLAGFSPVQGQFYLPRMAVQPPPELTSKIFPEVEEWLRKVDTGEYEQSIAAGGFLRLLLLLRVVILQDSVLLRQSHPSHPIWRHSIFSDPSYVSFADRLKHVMISEEDPTELQLQRALPVLAERISVMHQDLSSKVSGIDLKLSQQTEEIKKLGQHLEDIMQGRTEMRMTARFDMGWSDTTQGTRNNLDSAAEATRAGVVGTNRVGTDEEFPRKYKLSRGIDTIFTRLGASDRIMAGENLVANSSIQVPSWVDCNETSSVLNHATSDSLVIFDELGRGTFTYDGYAIAYAVFHKLVSTLDCLLIFATH